jgi:DNA mismatch repair ATPase MutS
MAPLTNIGSIVDRQEAVLDLQLLRVERKEFLKALKKGPDLERAIARICKYTVRSTASQAVYFQDISGTRFK